MTIWNAAKTRYRHLMELRGIIMRLNKQIETQAETIKNCHNRYAELAVKYNDLPKLPRHLTREGGLIGATVEYLKEGIK